MSSETSGHLRALLVALAVSASGGLRAAPPGAPASLATNAPTLTPSDTLAEVRRLVEGGQAAEAMRRADAALAVDPTDPSLRFMRGVMLADASRTAEAIAVYEKLTEDYPDLAEPYNNLAALEAGGGRVDKARAALEQALRVNPSYVTAWENLGDVLVMLAARAYAQVGRLDPANAGAQAKLRAVRAMPSVVATAAGLPSTSRPSTPKPTP